LNSGLIYVLLKARIYIKIDYTSFNGYGFVDSSYIQWEKMKVSKFLKVNTSILIEYVYDDNNNIGDPYIIVQNIKDNVLKLSYVAADSSLTNNIIKNQLFNIDSVGNVFGLIDPSIYNFLQIKQYPAAFPARHDTIKIHLPINYTFGEHIGCYIRVYTYDYNNIRTYDLSNFFFDSSDITKTYLVNLNNPPLLFQEKLWAKYLEIDIPSISYISGLRTSTGANPNTINYNLTNGIGLSTTSPIFIDFQFIDLKNQINNITTYNLAPKLTVSIPQSPDFEKLGLIIMHSSQGDFLEIYGTYNGNISEFNKFINNSITLGKRYYVEFNITLFEQNIRGKTSKIVLTDGFNEKVEYRPIIKYSTTTAVIDVEMNVIDAVDNSSIQRRASYGMLQDEVSKYSINLTKINLDNATKPKIYNIKSPEGAGIFGNINGSAYSDGRLYGSAGGSLFSTGNSKNLFGLGRGKSPVSNSQNGTGVISDSSKSNPALVPYAVNYVVLSDRFKVVAKSANVKIGMDNFYGIGKLKILIQPFDQLIQFTIASDVSSDMIMKNSGNGSRKQYTSAPKYMDLSGMGDIKLVFKNTKLTTEFGIFTENAQYDLTKGIIIFKVSQNKISDIRQIYNSGINVFYITSSINGLTTVVYSGLFNLYDDLQNVNSLNVDQKANEVSESTNAQPSNITVIDATKTGTAIVTKKITPPSSNSANSGVGSNNTSSNQTTNTQNGSSVSSSSSTPNTFKFNSVIYEITSDSGIKINGYYFSQTKIKSALSLSLNSYYLNFKSDSLYSQNLFLIKLSDLKSKFESNLIIPDSVYDSNPSISSNPVFDRRSNYDNIQSSFLSANSKDPIVSTITTNTPPIQPIQSPTQTTNPTPPPSQTVGNYRILNKKTNAQITQIPEATALKYSNGDAFNFSNKYYIIVSIDSTKKIIYANLDSDDLTPRNRGRR